MVNTILERVAGYVTNLITTGLPAGMEFHNLKHTLDVVDAVGKIGSGMNVSAENLQLLKIAAWFHDVGYCFSYANHEEVSAFIAAFVLRTQNYDEALIENVKKIILATKVPQQPLTLLEEIICDADLSHFAKEDYGDYNQRLKLEWELKLDRRYTDKVWLQSNIDLFNTHHYFTSFARYTLNHGKQENLTLLLAKAELV